MPDHSDILISYFLTCLGFCDWLKGGDIAPKLWLQLDSIAIDIISDRNWI